jgi:hypothetical protein
VRAGQHRQRVDDEGLSLARDQCADAQDSGRIAHAECGLRGLAITGMEAGGVDAGIVNRDLCRIDASAAMSRRIASDTARRPAAFSAALIRDAFVAGSCPKWLMSAPRALAEKGRPKRSRDLHGSGAVG